MLNKIKSLFVPQKKSCQSSYSPLGAFELLGYGYANKNGWIQLSANTAFGYYMSVSVIYDAVDKISNEFSNNIKPILVNRKTGEKIKEFDSRIDASKVLLLLERGNFDKTGNELFNEFAINYWITGNGYKVVLKNSAGQPIEIFSVKSQDVTIQNASNGLPYSYQINNDYFGGKIFKRKEPEYRFVSSDDKYEIWHTRVFNPMTNAVYGLSPLTPLYYEIEQFIESNIHNKSLLKQGARPSGVLQIDKNADGNYVELSDAGRQRLKKQIENYYKGSSNAGNVLILEGSKEFKELSINNKDMDFANLKNMVAKQIYQNLGIPTTLVFDDTKTMNNYQASEFIFYDMTILPYSKMEMKELSRFLLPLYKDGDQWKLTYDEGDIPALQEREFEKNKELVKLGILTDNENREKFGALPLKAGGDSIYRPMNQIPIGQVSEQKGNKIPRERYTELLSRYKNDDGTQKYSNTVINKKADEYYSN